ncbi:MAG: heme-binding protein [Anaerolineae bacterium]|jgi:glc operon protein GlcG|nr:heme-binding protein [Anaerolineae bacterium]
MKTLRELSHADAQAILDAIRAECERKGQGAAVAVVDGHGELLAFLRMDGCGLPPIAIAQNKAYTAAREGIPSKLLGERSRAEGFPMTNFGELRYVTWGGGLPIRVEGALVGAVGVSGLPEDEDIRLAHIGVAAVGGVV